MYIDVTHLKSAAALLNLAIEKTKINPKSGWVEMIKTDNGHLIMKVANYDYYVEADVPIKSDDESFHATVSSDTFLPLIAKIDCDAVSFKETESSVIMTTPTSEYTLPAIKEGGRVKCIDAIKFNPKEFSDVEFTGEELSSVATINSKGLIDSLFSREIQAYIYVDDLGAITYTENIYINDFEKPKNCKFKFLLNSTQVKLLNIFKGFEKVQAQIAIPVDYTSANKIKIYTDSISLTMIVQSQQLTDQFPSIRLRKLAEVAHQTHVVVNKAKVDKALARLMIFDKRFDVTVMNYSKIVFGKDSMRLVSIRNRNYEDIPYISSSNAFEHESIIRFADLVKQLKVISSKEIDISYGDTPAITINSNITQLIPEVELVERV